MEGPTYIKPEFPSDAFAGTAHYYARYRLPYPSSLIADLLHRAAITSGGRLLDLATGPGRIAIPLAGHFREVWAVDLEPEMIAVGEQEARQRGVTNIRWMTGKAEELVAEPDSFDLITIGEAFHRLDQQLIAARCRQWLRPGCRLAILGCCGITKGSESWQRAVADTVRHWRNLSLPEDKQSRGPRPGSGPDHNAAVLRDAGFAEVANYSFVHPHEWTVESIIGQLYSTSHSSQRLLGKNVPAFERDMEQALLKCDPSGSYHQDVDCGYTLGRKPAGGQFRVDRLRRTGNHATRNSDHALQFEMLRVVEEGCVGLHHNLRHPVVIAQIDEQQAAVVAFTEHPTREADLGRSVLLPQFVTRVRPIGMHGEPCAGLQSRGPRQSPLIPRALKRRADGQDVAPPPGQGKLAPCAKGVRCKVKCRRKKRRACPVCRRRRARNAGLPCMALATQGKAPTLYRQCSLRSHHRRSRTQCPR